VLQSGDDEDMTEIVKERDTTEPNVHQCTVIIILTHHAMVQVQPSTNVFDNLLALTLLQGTAAVDELRLYLNTEVENVVDMLQWWYEKRKTYPSGKPEVA
jgi:hypothetical protein